MMTIICAVGVWGAYVRFRDEELDNMDTISTFCAGIMLAYGAVINLM